MRHLRKALVMAMAMVMALMTSLTAFATAGTTTNGYEDKEVKVTISSDELIKGHRFVAYQIFKGTQEDGTGDSRVVPGNHLGNVEWGSGIDLNATSQVKIVGSDGKEQEITKTFLEELKELVLDGKNGADPTMPFEDIIVFEDTPKLAYAENALRVSEKIEELWKADGYTGTVNTSDENAYEYSPEFQRFMDDFARIAARYVKNGKELQTLGDTTNEKTFYLPSGYYLIVDETSEADLTNKDGEIVGVTNVAVFQPTLNIEIRLKTDKPSLDKHIEVDKNVTTVDGDGNEVVETQKETTDYNNAAIGDTVNFLVTSTVPNMTHYHTYKFVVNDLLSEGFDYNEGSVKIKVGETPLKLNDDFEVKIVKAEDYEGLSDDEKTVYGLTDATFTGDYAQGTYIRIIFKDFYEEYLNRKGEAIEVRYSATVNELAKIGDAGNPNTAKLQYWRNPDIREEGIPGDDFKPDEPKGETPWEVTLTYVTALKLTKVDGENPEREDAGLAGAEFSITGEKLNKAWTVGYVYQKVEEGATGAYYKLKDGTYTTTAPDDNMDLYESSDMYEKVEIKDEVTECEQVNFGIEVDGNGVLSLTGLSEGEYIFKEIKAPYGYNLLKDPIKVIITWKAPETKKTEDGNILPSDVSDKCVWTAKYGMLNDDPETYEELSFISDAEEGGFKGGFAFEVENYTGALLPRTGGIGTTIFYVVGCALVVVAGVLLVLKRRANTKED